MFGIGITAKWKRARVLFESQQVNTLRNPVRHFRFPSCDIPYVVSGRLPQSIVEPVSNFDLFFYLIFLGFSISTFCSNLLKMLLISSKSLVILSSFSSLVLSQTGQFAANLNPQGLGCADPKGYLSCYEQNAQDAAQCADRAPSTCPPDKDSQDACLASCGYRQLAANLACWLTSCWNMVRIQMWCPCKRLIRPG